MPGSIIPIQYTLQGNNTSSGSIVESYAEFGWVTSPNSASQAILGNTLTTVTMSAEIRDDDNIGSLSNNQITLVAGTYDFEINLGFTTGTSNELIVSLFNVTDSVYVERGKYLAAANTLGTTLSNLHGRFTITTSKTFDIRVLSDNTGVVGAHYSGTLITSVISNGDQRVTARFKKLSSLNITNLTSVYTPSYAEYGWVCAPNTAGQSISANTITTLTIDTEVQDDNNIGSISGNQISLIAGTYYFEAFAPIYQAAGFDCVLSLYNVTDASYITRRKIAYPTTEGPSLLTISGQFTISTLKTFRIQALSAGGNANNGQGTTALTLGTSGSDQRTTLKLWRLR